VHGRALWHETGGLDLNRVLDCENPCGLNGRFDCGTTMTEVLGVDKILQVGKSREAPIGPKSDRYPFCVSQSVSLA
jgi:hypothetical protein